MEQQAHDTGGDDGVRKVEIPSEPELFEEGERVEVCAGVEVALLDMLLGLVLVPRVDGGQECGSVVEQLLEQRHSRLDHFSSFRQQPAFYVRDL